VSERRKGLFRDFIAAFMTSLLGWVFNDNLSWGLGLVVALLSGVILVQQIGNEIKRRVDAWLNS
jgi:short subunit fatty acids transporter